MAAYSLSLMSVLNLEGRKWDAFTMALLHANYLERQLIHMKHHAIMFGEGLTHYYAINDE